MSAGDHDRAATASPLLLVGALLLWGWQTGCFLPSLLMSTALGSAWLVRYRHRFGDSGFHAVWDVCSVATLLAAVAALSGDVTATVRVLQSFNPNPHAPEPAAVYSAYALMQWVPMLLFPCALAQVYATSERMPLTTFFWLLRGEGAAVEPADGINVSYPYFAICLAGAGAANQRTASFFVGLAVLLFAALLRFRSRRFPWPIWLGTAALTVLLGYWGQGRLHALQSVVENRLSQVLIGSPGSPDAAHARTAIGRVSDLKLSAAVIMEIRCESTPPELLPEASYSNYSSGAWFAHRQQFVRLSASDPIGSWQLAPGPGRHTMEITRNISGRSQLLALPSPTIRLEHLVAAEVARNRYGAVRTLGGGGFQQFTVQYANTAEPGAPPDSADLEIPRGEQATVSTAVAQLRLAPTAPLPRRLLAVREFFRQHFFYSTSDLPTGNAVAGRNTALARFLLDTRSGHCEFFATATVLMLRELGVPARYTIGYAVYEQDRRGDCYVVRHRHGHAWCRYFAGGRWHDFDTTPASWRTGEAEHRNLWNRFRDWLSDLRFALRKAVMRFGGWRRVGYLLLTVLLGLGGWRVLGRRRGRSGRAANENPAEPLPPPPGADSPVYLVEQRLAALGHRRQSGETMERFLTRATAAEGILSFAAPLTAGHYRLRFSPEHNDARASLADLVGECLEQLDAIREHSHPHPGAIR